MESAQESTRSDFTDLGDYTKHIRFARVTKVYDADTLAESKDYGSVNLVWLDTGDVVNGKVSFLKPGYSGVFGYGIVVMPSVGDIAACYTLQAAQPIILGFFSKNQFQAITADLDNAQLLGPMRALKSGEILIKGRSQSEVLFSKDGRINVTIKDGTNTNPVFNEDNSFTSEKFLDKASAKPQNTVLELELGKSDKLAGPATQIFSITDGSYSLQTFEIYATKNVLQYTLSPVTQAEIVSVDSVKLFTVGTDGKRVLKKTLGPNSGVGLIKSYYYTQGLSEPNDAAQFACTMDSNGMLTSVTLPASVAGLLNDKTLVSATVWVKRVKFGFRVNELGDAIMDCRNFVVRSNESKSYLGLFDDARAVIGGTVTELGDKMTGYVRTSRSGVQISSGMYSSSDIEQADSEDVKDIVGAKYYFYNADEFPLICYVPDDKSIPFHIVDIPEYLSLSNMDKSRITCRPFDPEQSQEGFTRTKLFSLLSELKDANTPWTSYGSLRAL